MGFHKRHISNDQVIDIFRSQGIDGVRDWYTRKVDAVITEAGLASDIYDLMQIVEARIVLFAFLETSLQFPAISFKLL